MGGALQWPRVISLEATGVTPKSSLKQPPKSLCENTWALPKGPSKGPSALCPQDRVQAE